MTENSSSSPFFNTKYWLILLTLSLVGIVVSRVAAPLHLIAPLSFLVTVFYLALPCLAIYNASKGRWTPIQSVIFIIIGVFLHISLDFISSGNFPGTVKLIASALGPIGVTTWCFGLGALISSGLKEKNLLMPVGIALAGIDIFYVLTPIGITQKVIKSNPEVLQKMALNVPQVQTKITHGALVPLAFIGPADLMFTATLLVAAFKFNMRPLQTIRAIIPVLVIYMVVVLYTGMPLPALVPIGITFLIVNFREFNLTKSEWAMTGFVALLFVALISFGLTRKPQSGPLIEGDGPTVPELPERQLQGGQDPPRSQDQTAPQSTPNPQ